MINKTNSTPKATTSRVEAGASNSAASKVAERTRAKMILPNNGGTNDDEVSYSDNNANKNNHSNDTSDDYSEDDSNDDYGKNGNNCNIRDGNNEDEDDEEVNYANLPKMSNEPKITNVLRLLRVDEDDEDILGKNTFYFSNIL